MKKLFFCVLIPLCFLQKIQSQVSISTDFSVIKNYSKDESFRTIGQTVRFEYQLGYKDAAYFSMNFFSNGRFDHQYLTEGRFPTINPSSYPYTVTSRWRFKEISLGLKHYFRGGYDQDMKWNYYGLAGFGFLTAIVNNNYSIKIDTSRYTFSSPREGSGKFKRLTFDLGLGAEYPFGGNFFGYADARVWIPTSESPSEFIRNNHRFIPVIASVGVRFLLAYNDY